MAVAQRRFCARAGPEGHGNIVADRLVQGKDLSEI